VNEVTAALLASDLSHSFGTVQALSGVSVEVQAGEALALVGESGSGKSTLLRSFNRLVEPGEGRVLVQGEDVSAIDPVALRRRIGYVPQTGGLLPHWTVQRNVALVPELLRQAMPLKSAAIALELVGLPVSDFGSRYPSQLSGGQRQRVALARALAAQQQIVLLDEPFGALDAISRSTLHEVFARVRAELGFTAILVTHDIAEAAKLAGRIAVMRAGRIEQMGTFHALRSAPATPYVPALIEQAIGSAASLAQGT
jgi:osmoprotectant transport system ATP-binding protein